MKSILKTSMLLVFFFFAASIKQGESPRIKHGGYFTASIDGRPFDTRHYEHYTAEISNQSEYSRNEQSADLTFSGAKHYDNSGNAFEESLQFKYILSESNPTEISGQKIVFLFNNQKFISIPGQTKLRITKMSYSDDRTSMIVSGDFEAKMTQWAAPGQAQLIVKVKGKMEGINISIPATARPTAGIE
jgi:hypothetical protein